MKIILQRVLHAQVVINGGAPKSISQGLVALVGFTQGDNNDIVDYMVNKMLNLRIFDDKDGNLNLALTDISGELMLVSNFTLYANCRKGRRPAFIEALNPKDSIPLYDYMVAQLEKSIKTSLVTGEFGANMQITLCNDGPVTIDLDSEEIMAKKGE